MYFSKSAIVKNDNCLIVEGYTDVISMHKSGIENVVASSGTAIGSEQIKLIGRYTKNITFCLIQIMQELMQHKSH